MEKERKRIKSSENGKMDRRGIDFSRYRRRLMRLLRRRKRTVTAAAASCPRTAPSSGKWSGKRRHFPARRARAGIFLVFFRVNWYNILN